MDRQKYNKKKQFKKYNQMNKVKKAVPILIYCWILAHGGEKPTK